MERLKEVKNLTEKVAWALAVIKEDPDLDKNITNVNLAKKLGTNKDTLADYIKGKGLLKGEVIENLVSIYNFNPLWLFKGIGEPFPGARNKYKDVCGPEIKEKEIGLPDDTKGDFVFVPLLRDKISAGAGLLAYNAIDVRVAFRRAWIKRKGDPNNMSLIKVSGDSMEPTLMSGDLVLVDHSKTYIDPQGGIYAITMNDTIMIKRLQIIYQNHKVLIISDNNRYEPFETDLDSVQINGKVIWFARELER